MHKHFFACGWKTIPSSLRFNFNSSHYVQKVGKMETWNFQLFSNKHKFVLNNLVSTDVNI